jgi:hypothetical protein
MGPIVATLSMEARMVIGIIIAVAGAALGVIGIIENFN